MADIDEKKVKIGELNGKPVYAGSPVKGSVADKERKSWEKELIEIKGITSKTTNDILKMYGSEEELIEALNHNVVALGNDDVKLLKTYYADKLKGGDK